VNLSFISLFMRTRNEPILVKIFTPYFLRSDFNIITRLSLGNLCLDFQLKIYMQFVYHRFITVFFENPNIIL
jgi:hypothetical protein